ncbi:sigma-70 family RNA polymerase sigma factor [Mucilaginibacter conchicola]|uniref:Sigma-70 family RNA polymerase sigma factor n=1 Tax=Mucilaginibacter conchicola TaxID=2303333 RepID=A0A372P125_9SPHI|nr:sigma-70 family RNA polymerase sigma factor [Mucilaginibacter conchicola]RFZ95619.1 sigma-70 family RNA polymerase sigma factor [Mucilaginibacter conchicola]
MKTIALDACIAACKKGDRRAQELVYKHFAAQMFGICRRYTQNTMEAEDILQEAFVKVFTKINLYTGDGSFEGWVRRIIVNTALTTYRNNQRRIKTSDLESCEYAVMNYSQTEDADATAHLYNSINMLPQSYRMPFNLFAIEGYSHHEIAEMMGISVMQSRTTVCRARMALRKSLSLGESYSSRDRELIPA